MFLRKKCPSIIQRIKKKRKNVFQDLFARIFYKSFLRAINFGKKEIHRNNWLDERMRVTRKQFACFTMQFYAKELPPGDDV